MQEIIALGWLCNHQCVNSLALWKTKHLSTKFNVVSRVTEVSNLKHTVHFGKKTLDLINKICIILVFARREICLKWRDPLPPRVDDWVRAAVRICWLDQGTAKSPNLTIWSDFLIWCSSLGVGYLSQWLHQVTGKRWRSRSEMGPGECSDRWANS